MLKEEKKSNMTDAYCVEKNEIEIYMYISNSENFFHGYLLYYNTKLHQKIPNSGCLQITTNSFCRTLLD